MDILNSSLAFFLKNFFANFSNSVPARVDLIKEERDALNYHLKRKLRAHYRTKLNFIATLWYKLPSFFSMEFDLD